jgi:membrane-bound lytic murein transglycosylase C
MRKVVLLITSIFISSLSAESYSDYLKAQNSEFNSYAQSQNKEFNSYKKAIEKEFKTYKKIAQKEEKAYKRELSRFWRDTQISNNKKWVEYSPNKKRRKIVDFEKNTVEVQIISKPSKSIEKELMKEVLKTVTATPKDAEKSDQLEKRIDEKFQKQTNQQIVKAKVDNSTAILNGVFRTPPSSRELVQFAKKSVKKVQQRSSKISGQRVYSVKIKLPKYFPIRKAKSYSSYVNRYAKQYKVEPALVYAIMHSESSFNPRAKSHIPAYGLMQIVPRSAGIDAYYMVYKKKRLLSSSYLYNSRNNIELGSAYLHILNYRYLKSIKNPVSRLYCVISAYNTGAGNVARTFVGTNSVKKASKIINRMSPQQVYNKLIRDLPYDETRRYLKKVSKRYSIYKSVNI